jgi:spore coat polysaccharide biosynthesis protein SpsF
MSRRLVAALPCRVASSRLYGKPLQPLVGGLPIIAYLTGSLQRDPAIAEVRFAVADGPGNSALTELAQRLHVSHYVGCEHDVLGRVIECARAAGATDVLRKTSEDPFFDYSMLTPAWESHLERGNDVTALDWVPEGTAFEIFTLAALERCHERGTGDDHEHIANYARFNQTEFRVEVLAPPPPCRRLDLRLTVDNPADLTLCRAVASDLREYGPQIPLSEIIAYLDRHPELTKSVAPYVDPNPTWQGVPQRTVLV